MNITAVKGQITTKPMGVNIYARSGMGKTTFLGEYAKNAKSGILFQCGEDGLSDLKPEWANEVPTYPNILGDYYETAEDTSKWSDMQKASQGWIWFRDELMKFLMVGKHDFTNIAFDNFDNLINRNLDAYVTLAYYKGNINSANAYGGSKLKEMYSELAMIVKCFEYLQKKGISIFLGYHAQAINFRDPAGQDFKRWSIAIPAREDYGLRALLINWSSCTLFGTMDVEVENKKASGNRHILYTKESAGFESKSRYDLPEVIDFSYNSFKDAVLKCLKK